MPTRSMNAVNFTRTAFVNPTTATDTAVVAAVTNSRIRVHAVSVVTTIANNVLFKSATTAISATAPLAANGGYILPYSPEGWFTTAVGEALNFTTSAATACGCTVVYSVE